MEGSSGTISRLDRDLYNAPVLLEEAMGSQDDKLSIVVPDSTDAAHMSALISDAVPDCVPQTEDEIRSRLHEYEVARYPWQGVVGTAAVRPIDGERAELRGLAIKPTCRGRGLGKVLVGRAVLRALGAGKRLVCVTRRPDFFRELGFSEIPLDTIPSKKNCCVAADCGRPRVAMAWGGA